MLYNFYFFNFLSTQVTPTSNTSAILVRTSMLGWAGDKEFLTGSLKLFKWI